MARTWVCADHHFGHANILTFTDDKGVKLRGSVFKDTDEHDQQLIERHNAVVNDEDRVYMLGDVVINRRHLWKLGQLKGRKVLVKGNHDIAKLKEYLPYFDDIRAYVVQLTQEKHKVILSHIPIHSDCLGRFGTNIHGHLHQNKIDDPRYICVSLEHTGYAPIEVHEALKLKRNS
jgi:calcineurin-like phosphoesterase family protein